MLGLLFSTILCFLHFILSACCFFCSFCNVLLLIIVVPFLLLVLLIIIIIIKRLAVCTGAAECSDCPPGWLCLEGEEAQPCPEGHYCLGGRVEDVLPCPPGTYNPKAGQRQVEQCSLCSAGENSAPAMLTSLAVLIALIGYCIYYTHLSF